MWRTTSVHERGDSQPLEVALEAVMRDTELLHRAESVLRAAAAQEPILAAAWKTPQTPPFHAEGPFLSDHVRRILAVLFAVQSEKLHLIDIEEFRRLKGYEGEIEELEETLKEYGGMFVVFALCHDAAKGATLHFSVRPGSKGEELGFGMEAFAVWDDLGVSERAKFRERYAELYGTFASGRPQLNPNETQTAFFEAYGIRAHYPGHDRAIHAPQFSALLTRLARAYEVTDRDRAMLMDVIAHHLHPINDFSREAPPARMDMYVRLAEERGYDSDDFVDIMQAGVFLDVVAGSVHCEKGHTSLDAAPLINFLRAEHDWAPWKRTERAARREATRQKERNRLLREVGLDGVALLEVLGMEPGPEFGQMLRGIHDAIVGKSKLPPLPAATRKIIEDRAEKFYELAFPPSA